MRTLVLMLTDVQGSTRLWQDEPTAMDAAMQRHHEIVHGAVAEHGGFRPVDQGEGDAVFAAFDSASAAIAAVAQVQRALAAESWPTSVPLRSRIGVHVGEVTERGGNLFGDPVNRCARVRGLASGGQTLLSAPVYELVRDKLPTGCSVRDLGEHRMKDLVRPEHVWQLDVDGLATDFPPLASLDRVLHNLPVQRSPLIGRDEDLARVVAAVREHRLVTLTGFGGMGKTRLALQVAAEVVDDFPDGAWFVDLASVTDPEAVPGVVAHSLGVAEVDPDAVLTELARREVLLVLDNLEQVLGCASFVAQVLDRAPGARVLTTSREPLRVRGERELALAPLALPPVDGETSAESLSAYAAVQLFVDRAVAVRQDFAVDNANAAAVAAICQQLDGHPLAIELAASRVRMMTPEALLPRLDRALSVLTGGARDMPGRHQTLRATIAWSYDDLGNEEKLLLQRMSALPAPADFATVEHVCGEDLDVFSALAGLTEKSLVRVLPGPDEDRYGLLVSIRAFAAELLPNEEGARVRLRHLAWFSERYRARPRSREEDTRVVASAERELDHLAAAWTTAQDQENVDWVHRFPQVYPMKLAWTLGDADRAVAVLEAKVDAATGPTLDLALALESLVLLEHELGARVSADHRTRFRALAEELDREDVRLQVRLCDPPTGEDPQELLDLVDDLRARLPGLPEDSPWDVWWLHDMVDNCEAVFLRYVAPERALEAARRNQQSGSMRDLAEANLALSLLLLGRPQEVLELFATVGPPDPTAMTSQAAHMFACRASTALLAVARSSEAADLLKRWDRFAAAKSPDVQTLHAVHRALLLLHEGDAAAAVDALAGHEQGRWTPLATLVRLRAERLAGRSADPADAASAAAQLEPQRWRRHYELWLALRVEQALREPDPAERARLARAVEADRGRLCLPYGYADDLQRLLQEA